MFKEKEIINKGRRGENYRITVKGALCSEERKL